MNTIIIKITIITIIIISIRIIITIIIIIIIIIIQLTTLDLIQLPSLIGQYRTFEKCPWKIIQICKIFEKNIQIFFILCQAVHCQLFKSHAIS